jgi:quercetin dioxygenase-like cupin family protein
MASAATLAGVAALSAAGGQPAMRSTVFDWNAMKVTPTQTGEVRRIVARPTATLDELGLHVTTLEAGVAAHPPHRHPDEEMMIVKDGTLEVLTNDVVTRVGPGSVMFYASDELHGVKNVGADSASYFVIRWKSSGTMKKE